ncbi:MAG: hypothetical protein M1826_001421 [Phylliscum demangeonii]|nr:MAG: hypothetical protein M1826_001421 [Phylliscum demangeonii]
MTPRLVLGLFVFEFPLIVASLALFGMAAPNAWRTDLWKDGALNGFNSDPIQVVYAFANYRPIPRTAVVWSQFITNWNVAISVVSMFALLIKAVMHVMRVFYPVLSLLIHSALLALWAVSVSGQAGSDHSDPKHPSTTPWYLTKSCRVAHFARNVRNCQLAKSSFAVSVILLALFASHIPLAVYSILRGPSKRRERQTSTVSDFSTTESSPDSAVTNDKAWELDEVPRLAKGANTPRSLAFKALSAWR